VTPEAIRESLGRMLMVGLRGAEPGDPDLEADLGLCAKHKAAGVILFDRDIATESGRNITSPEQIARLTAHIRERLGADTLIAVDQEGGRVQRLNPAAGFGDHPSAAGFAEAPRAEQSEFAASLVCELADAGINMNFAPCVDLATVTDSGVIGALDRAFGAEPDTVTECAKIVATTHTDARIACCLKHFPGHGSAASDSHHALPDITGTFDRDAELAPYRALLEDNPLICVMTGHLLCRGLDSERPASLSEPITRGLLRAELGFDGLVATDALDMEGVRSWWSLAECLALAAGATADLLVHACNSRRGERAADVFAALDHAAEVLARRPKIGRRLDESLARLDRTKRAAAPDSEAPPT